jgi:phytoene synthase
MIRQGSRSFHLASLLLPESYREYARGLYGFCRMADDLVDKSSDPAKAVDVLHDRLGQIYAGSPHDAPADRAFADVVHRFGIPSAVPEALIDGFLWDAQGKRYDSLSDVVAYSVRVAGTVGVMMSLIMGQRAPQALARAIDLGIAMQLSNIARDVEEDRKLGRVYLPQHWLDESDAEHAAGRLVETAESFYQRAASGIAMLPASCRSSINAASLLYREIGLRAVRQKHVGRAVVPGHRKAVILAKAIAQAPFLSAAAEWPCEAEGLFLLDAVAKVAAVAPLNKGWSAQMDWVFDMLITVEGRRP